MSMNERMCVRAMGRPGNENIGSYRQFQYMSS